MASLRDVMVADPITAEADATVAAAAAAMVGARVGSLLVQDESGLGILTERDVMRAAGAGDLLSTRVRDWMTLDPTTAPPDQAVDEAVVTMLDGGFRHLPVVEGGRLVGIVSVRTLLAALHGGTVQPAGGGADATDPAPADSSSAVQHRRSQMFDATRLLQQRSHADLGDHDRWRRGLAEAVTTLGDVLAAHIAETEGPDGFLQELVRESDGRLGPAVRRLGREHERSSAMLAALSVAVDDRADPTVLRQSADELFAQLEAHRHRGSDLLWRAHAVELGVGD